MRLSGDGPYPGHSTSTVLPVVSAQDLKVNVGVGSVVTELQPAGETTHSTLKMRNTYTDQKPVVEEVFRYFTEVKVSIQQCENTPLPVKVLHEKSYLSKSISSTMLLKY